VSGQFLLLRSSIVSVFFGIVPVGGIHCRQAVDFSFAFFVGNASRLKSSLWPRAIGAGGYIGEIEIVIVQFAHQEAVFQAMGDIVLIAGGAGVICRLILFPLAATKRARSCSTLVPFVEGLVVVALIMPARFAKTLVAVDGGVAVQDDSGGFVADVAAAELAVRGKYPDNRLTGLEPVGLVTASVVVVAAFG